MPGATYLVTKVSLLLVGQEETGPTNHSSGTCRWRGQPMSRHQGKQPTSHWPRGNWANQSQHRYMQMAGATYIVTYVSSLLLIGQEETGLTNHNSGDAGLGGQGLEHGYCSSRRFRQADQTQSNN